MLAPNSASRTFAYKRLAQALSRALSAMSSFIREHFVLVTKADFCAQYVDDIGKAANSLTQHMRNIRAVFEGIRFRSPVSWEIQNTTTDSSPRFQKSKIFS